jgi:iron(III) transport system ATP-binding protein
VRAGEVVCLLGPSGCGKSTLLRRIAAGLETLQQGSVRIAGSGGGHDPTAASLPPERRNLGLMFQDSALFPHLTVLENVTFGLGHRMSQAERRERALALLGQLHMAEFRRQLSARAVRWSAAACGAGAGAGAGTALMLLDEPFSSAGCPAARPVSATIRCTCSSRSGAGTLLVTHDPRRPCSWPTASR